VIHVRPGVLDLTVAAADPKDDIVLRVPEELAQAMAVKVLADLFAAAGKVPGLAVITMQDGETAAVFASDDNAAANREALYTGTPAQCCSWAANWMLGYYGDW